MMNLNKRLDLIEPKILEPSFRAGRGTANEINFWIFDYDPEDELAVRSHVEHLTSRINGKRDSVVLPSAKPSQAPSDFFPIPDVRIACFDLYDLMLEVLHDKNYLDRVMQMEQSRNSVGIVDPLKKTLRLTEESNLIIEKIMAGLTPERDIIFLTGIGKAWPIIRSHTILNNLHSKVDKNPLVMFFPGQYTSELRLFGEITDDNYYRAFKLIER